MNEMMEKKWGISGFTLKCLAMITMLIDHAGMALYPQEIWMRGIGRLAFPIYCFLLVEGAVHTTDRIRYLKRLFLFAWISEIPFDLVRRNVVWDMDAQNVFFTLFLGLLTICVFEHKPFKAEIQNKVYSVVGVLAIACIAEFGNFDYGSAGILMILCLYIFYQHKYVKLLYLAAINLLLFGGIESLQSYAIFSIVPIFCYNGKRGPNFNKFNYDWIKYVFYIFYPAHLLVLYWLRFRL